MAQAELDAAWARVGRASGLFRDTAYDVFSLVTGALVGPLVASWLAPNVSHG